MPLKWKIFFALNIVLSLPALISFILLFLRTIDNYNRYGDYFLAVIVLLALLLITLNGFLNIYLLQRFFPDKLVPAAARTVYMISFVLNILVSIGILVLCIYAANLEFADENNYEDNRGKRALAIIFFLWLVQVVILIMQGQLPVIISRNNRKQINSLIDSIGQ